MFWIGKDLIQTSLLVAHSLLISLFKIYIIKVHFSEECQTVCFVPFEQK